MADPLSFNPTFKHVDWVDSIDRVRAGGGNGFNIRFQAIETDLETLSDVIKAIKTRLGVTPAATQVALTLTPSLVPIGNDSGNAWAHGKGYAQKPITTTTSASGMMSVSFPDGVQLLSFRATGRNDNNPASSTGLHIALCRYAVTDPTTTTSTPPEELFSFTVKGGGTYDIMTPGPTPPASTILGTVAPAADLKVDAKNFRYFITAELSSQGTMSALAVTINTFQIIYQ